MKYIKTFEDNDDVITHEKIKQCSKIIQKNAGINDSNGFYNWYTNNWCFNHNTNEKFFCSYYFYLINKSASIKFLKKYLRDNNINFEYYNDDFKNDIKIIRFNLEKVDILYYIIKDEEPTLTDNEIVRKIDIILEDERIKKASKIYNL